MKVTIYKRVQRTWHVHAIMAAEIIFIPDKQIAIYREQQGSFGDKIYGTTKEDRILTEAKSVHDGYVEGYTAEGLTISDIFRTDLLEAQIGVIVDSIDLRDKLDEKIRSAVNMILDGRPKAEKKDNPTES